MALSMSDTAYKQFRSVIKSEKLLAESTDLSNVVRFKVEAHTLENRTMKKERTVIFEAANLEVNQSLGKGCFHKAYKGIDVEGFVWVFKKPLLREEIDQIAPDFLKQVMAFELSREFTHTYCSKFKECFLLYNKPYIATVTLIFKNGGEHFLQGTFFEMESFLEGHFDKFNAPNGSLNVTNGPLAPNRLPQIFSLYTYEVTGGRVLVNDVQGCKLARGQYWCTDPIVFTHKGDFGHVDHGRNGMKWFLHKIDECSALQVMVEDVKKETVARPEIIDRMVQLTTMNHAALANNIHRQLSYAIKKKPLKVAIEKKPVKVPVRKEQRGTLPKVKKTCTRGCIVVAVVMVLLAFFLSSFAEQAEGLTIVKSASRREKHHPVRVRC